MLNDKIIIKGARENNLKNVDIELPKNKLIVLTGLSGSGKSTLAFDTIYAEGQRRYVESLSSYARQFLGGLEKPDVDSIEGLSPSIAIDQKTTSNNPRSTVGTVTEIYDYFRLLFARIGVPYCPVHNIPIEASTITQIVDKVLVNEEGSKVIVYSPLTRQKKGTHKELLENTLKSGFIRVRINGEIKFIEEVEDLDKNKKHDIDLVIDRFKLDKSNKSRIFDSIETALKWGDNMVIVSVNDNESLFSSNHSCPYCGFSMPKLEPRLFSFNSPLGACGDCLGIGVKQEVGLDLLIPDETKTLNEGAMKYHKNIAGSENIEWKEFEYLCEQYNIDMNKPYKDLTDYEKQIVTIGSDRPFKYVITTRSGNNMNRFGLIEGPKTHIERLFKDTTSEAMRQWYQTFMVDSTCPTCQGKRLNDFALAVLIDNKNIFDYTNMSIYNLIITLENLNITEQQREISRLIIKEILDRLYFLKNVGLEYLTLTRSSGSLSGGEAQRIRLATQIGSRLSGVLYVLDEPSIGLHQRDNEKLINALKDMRDLGNTLIVVEHDEDTMLASDYLVDIGPGAGVHGGRIVAQGTPLEVMGNEDSITGRYLSHKEYIPLPNEYRKGNGKFIEIKEAEANNLKKVNVDIPLGCLVVVTGVSGSGKSSLVEEVLAKNIEKRLGKSKVVPGKVKDILGVENIDKLIKVDQSPIGRTPRSNPATYTGVFDNIRDLYASTKDAKARGYDKGRFSFNVRGGRCERCQGDGVIRVPMHFLPDVFVQCEECHGKRYNEETLQVYYKGKNIYDLLETTIEDACQLFENIPNISNKLRILNDVGLGYIKLGQSATTLSGGEAQRVKLANELQRRSTGKTLYILDEPTTGLHVHDVKKLIDIINRIVNNGDSVIIIEHNLDIIKIADYIIDIGPEGGEFGGTVVAKGTPKEISENENSYTGKFLKRYFK